MDIRNDDRSRIASSPHSSTSVVTPFQFRYETDIRNYDQDVDMTLSC
ncbi:MAG: hypothetical protein LBQ01_05290 [Prevotellaceae bacterium]|nr:hypothetical protein [Prevotellaceae bacterium]